MSGLPLLGFHDEAHEFWEDQMLYLADKEYVVKLTLTDGTTQDAVLVADFRNEGGMPALSYYEWHEATETKGTFRKVDAESVEKVEVY